MSTEIDLYTSMITASDVPLALNQHIDYAKAMYGPKASSGRAFPFPFSWQEGQKEFLGEIHKELDGYVHVTKKQIDALANRLSAADDAFCHFRIVYIRGGSVYFDSRQLEKCEQTGKLTLLDKHLRSVLHHARKMEISVSDVYFMFSTSADGMHDNLDFTPPPSNIFNTIPVFVIAKRKPEDPGVRVPNMYFGDIQWSWARNTKTVLDVSKSRKWQSRKSAAYWRGNCGHLREPSWPRVQVSELALDKNNSIDAALTEPIKFSLKGLDPREIIKLRMLPTVPRNNQLVLSTYKYLLNMPGSATGSYSKNLQVLWPHGSVVLMWETKAQEFYYDKLVPGVTHLVVNNNTVIDTLRWLQEHDDEAQTIAAAGLRVFQHYLSPDALTVYWCLALEAYTKKLELPYELPDDACTCEKTPFLERQKCPFCEDWITEKSKNTQALNSYLFFHGYDTKRK
eukprot:gene573-973_t